MTTPMLGRSSFLLDESQHSRQQLPFPSCYRLEYAREWGPCVIGLNQAIRGSLPSLAPPVFCGMIVPCVHEPVLESLGFGSGVSPAAISGGEQERMTKVVQSDSYIAWLLRTVPSDVVDGARCSMGILEHTTASSIIKEAISAGIEIRSVKISSYSDPVKFREFLYEAFPMIDNISVYPRVPSTAFSRSSCLSPEFAPTSSSSSMAAVVPPILCAAGVVAHSARDELSRHLLFRQRHFPVPIARSPLSRCINGLRRKEQHCSSPAASFFGDSSMYRSRSCLEDDCERTSIRCVPYAGSEYGEAHCGLACQSRSVPINNVYDYYGEDDDSDMVGLTSPKRLRVVPCSPPLSTVYTCEDSMNCVCPTSSNTSTNTHRTTNNSVASPDSPLYVTSSLLVSPPFATSCSTAASASVPMFPSSLFGIASPV